MTGHRTLTVLNGLLLSALLGRVACAEPVEPSREVTAADGSIDAPAASANSEPGSSGTSQRAATESHWYGGTIFVTDVAAIAMGYGSIRLSSSHDFEGLVVPLAIGASLSYLAGGPIVHAAHGRTGAAYGSLALRVGMPLAGAGVGALLGAAAEGDCTGYMCGLGAAIGGLFGFGAGMVVASVTDIVGLAYESVPPESGPRVAVAPTFDPKRGSAGLNVVGAW